MEISRRDFVFIGISGLASLLLPESLIAKENKPISLPTLEEITDLMSKEPEEILKPAIERGDIKKFEYTRNTNADDLYKFIKEIGGEYIITFIYRDKETAKKNTFEKDNNSYGVEVSSASAITVLYMALNLKHHQGVRILFFVFQDFHGKENWEKISRLFRVKELSFPSWAEFIKENNGYILKEMSAGGVLPKDINKYIELNVKEYLKK